jgi:hypothetical protein
MTRSILSSPTSRWRGSARSSAERDDSNSNTDNKLSLLGR